MREEHWDVIIQSILTQTGLNPMKVFGTLGSLSVMNETLPESHPHRYFVSVKKEENLDLTFQTLAYYFTLLNSTIAILPS